mgnify:CR=1 FL=1
MYNKNKDQVYQNTANMLKAASSYREVPIPVGEVAIQFSELLNEVRKNGLDENAEQPTEKKTKGGKKSKED